MNPETPQNPEQTFESLYQQITSSPEVLLIENIEGLSKVDFLKFLSEKGEFLFHGTNSAEIEELEPRQANCRAKNFGNLKAVYATTDPVLPIYHSVFNKKYFSGRSSSGVESGNKYVFKVDGKFGDNKTWTNGCVYILDKSKFEQGTDDEGSPIDEFACREPVKPLAKLLTESEDFPYLDEVEIVSQPLSKV
jgi:hypothetical protein